MPPDALPPDAVGAPAPVPPLPDAPLVEPPVALEPPEPVAPLLGVALPPDVFPGVPPLPVTGRDVSGATPWYCAWELDWASPLAGAVSANEAVTRRRQIRLLMQEP